MIIGSCSDCPSYEALSKTAEKWTCHQYWAPTFISYFYHYSLCTELGEGAVICGFLICFWHDPTPILVQILMLWAGSLIFLITEPWEWRWKHLGGIINIHRISSGPLFLSFRLSSIFCTLTSAVQQHMHFKVCCNNVSVDEFSILVHFYYLMWQKLKTWVLIFISPHLLRVLSSRDRW